VTEAEQALPESLDTHGVLGLLRDYGLTEFEAELEDPVLNRRITLRYDVRELPIAG
jgi:hypothetical protein